MQHSPCQVNATPFQALTGLNVHVRSQALPLQSSLSALLVVAIQCLDGTSVLILVPINQSDNGEVVWTCIRQKVEQACRVHRLDDWLSRCFAKLLWAREKCNGYEGTPCSWYFWLTTTSSRLYQVMKTCSTHAFE